MPAACTRTQSRQIRSGELGPQPSAQSPSYDQISDLGNTRCPTCRLCHGLGPPHMMARSLSITSIAQAGQDRISERPFQAATGGYEADVSLPFHTDKSLPCCLELKSHHRVLGGDRRSNCSPHRPPVSSEAEGDGACIFSILVGREYPCLFRLTFINPFIVQAT